MFPFGIFPFNIMPNFNPWWPLQAAQNKAEIEKLMPEYFKNYQQACTEWTNLWLQANPWIASYNKMLEK